MGRLGHYKNIFACLGIIVVTLIINQKIYGNYISSKRNIENELVKLKEGEVLITKWNKLNKDYASLRKNFLQGDALSFKQFVEKAAQESGVQIKSLKTSYKDMGHYRQASMKLEADADYKDLLAFFKLLEKKTVEIEKAAIRSNKSQQAKAKAMILSVELRGVLLGEG